MPDRAAFLAAIIGAPEDDLPRLVYVGWLDEHGDVDRAALIRDSITGRGLGLGPRHEANCRRDLSHLARFGVLWCSHSRGFVSVK